ncbi:MAG: DNA recombination protein RmuC [Candidatus Sumerlaeota bacterium]|nr:DNA recombination protein RmuC [Candidatus Sumerlaeota bacterium]
MSVVYFIVLAALLVIVIALQAVAILRARSGDPLEFARRVDALQTEIVRIEKSVRDETARGREEMAGQARQSREETAAQIKQGREEQAADTQRTREEMTATLRLIQEENATKLEQMRTTTEAQVRQSREEQTAETKRTREEMAAQSKQAREEQTAQNARSREEMAAALRAFSESLMRGVTDVSTLQKNQLDSFAKQIASLSQSLEQRVEALRQAVDQRLQHIQDDNSKKLDQMRETVDQKLQGALEKRLGESFRLVSSQLEAVHKGLGEMQSLATGVGDLKRVLSSVKNRGIMGEIQLAALLEQILTPEQYETNVAVRPRSAERVEFAIKMPGHGERDGQPLWLPIDAKFPQEDYQKILAAQDAADPALMEASAKDLEKTVLSMARDIRDKYIAPPYTTEYAVLFVPTEGLYAEILRRPGLFERLLREFRVSVAGPTTLAALLSSLQMGFQTQAIQKRSFEVWKLLSAIKTEFAKFGATLDKVKKNLDQASNTIDEASNRSRQIEKKLKKVQELPAEEAAALLPPPEDTETAEEATEAQPADS